MGITSAAPHWNFTPKRSSKNLWTELWEEKKNKNVARKRLRPWEARCNLQQTVGVKNLADLPTNWQQKQQHLRVSASLFFYCRMIKCARTNCKGIFTLCREFLVAVSGLSGTFCPPSNVIDSIHPQDNTHPARLAAALKFIFLFVCCEIVVWPELLNTHLQLPLCASRSWSLNNNISGQCCGTTSHFAWVVVIKLIAKHIHMYFVQKHLVFVLSAWTCETNGTEMKS